MRTTIKSATAKFSQYGQVSIWKNTDATATKTNQKRIGWYYLTYSDEFGSVSLCDPTLGGLVSLLDYQLTQTRLEVANTNTMLHCDLPVNEVIGVITEQSDYTVNVATGVKRLPDAIHEQVLGHLPIEPDAVEVEEIKWHHQQWSVDVPDETPEPMIVLPEWVPSVDSLNTQLRVEWLRVEEKMVRLLNNPISLPPSVPQCAGWNRLDPNLGWAWVEDSIVNLSDRAMVIDFETTKVAEDDWRPVCAVLVDSSTWWIWRADTRLEVEQLPRTIGVGRKNIYVGHNVGYDQNYISEEFEHQPSGSMAFCTMGAHILTNGVSNQQRPLLAMKDDENSTIPDWLESTSAASLDKVVELYLNQKLDKGVRTELIEGGWQWIRYHMDSVITYCCKDVLATHGVFRVLLPMWLSAVPDYGCRLGAMHQTSMYVPLSEQVDSFYSNAEDKYSVTKYDISDKLLAVARNLLDDLGQKLEWQEVCYEENTPGAIYWDKRQPKVNKKGQQLEGIKYRLKWIAEGEPTELEAIQIEQLDWTTVNSKAYGLLPRWIVDFYSNPSYGKNIVPIILGITWLGSPVRYVEGMGWCYNNSEGVLEQVPSPEKQGKPVHSMFVKGFCTRGSDDTTEEAVSALDSIIPGGRDILVSAMSLQFWRSFRKRVAALRVVKNSTGYRVAKPSFSRTVSNRCADPVWMVMSHPKPLRIGSWVRWLIQPPEGYVFVKADIDSQELDLFAAMGDAKYGFYGATPLGKSIRVGDKDKKTDPHSLLGVKTGITNRTLLKNINYGSIFGLALKGKADYVQKSNPSIARLAALAIAKTIGDSLEGVVSDLTGEYRNGMASDAFNAVARVYRSLSPRTPYGNMALSRALVKAGWKKYQTTFQNWVVQASGSCMTTKLLATCMHLFKLQRVPARLVITVHDELCFMVREDLAERVVLLMQLSHLLIRGDITKQLGLDCLPANGSWFSSVEVDRVFRKEAKHKASAPDMPSMDIPNGKVYTPSDIPSLLAA